MNSLERMDTILEYISDKEFVLVEDLVQVTNSSIATVRRDIKKLEQENKIERFRGGIRKAKDREILFALEERLIENKETKIRIARKAAELIDDNDIVYMDAGSTVYYMVDYITAKNIKVITNSIYTATKLIKKHIRTYILGGEVPFNDLNIFSQETIEKISTMNFDKAFISSSAIDSERGLSSTGELDSAVKTMALKRSNHSYVLVDKSKFGKFKMYSVASDNNETIITDYVDQSKAFKQPIINV